MIMIYTFGLTKPREDICCKLKRLLVRIPAAPLVLDGHLKALPLRQPPGDSILETVSFAGIFHHKDSSAAAESAPGSALPPPSEQRRRGTEE